MILPSSHRNEFLIRIARHLIVNTTYLDNLGLYTGKTGIIIFFAQLSSYLENTIYRDFAGKLLDEVFANIHIEMPVNMRNGLCGIGWTVEYLLREGFIEGNSNEVLSDIDKKVMEYELNRICDESFETGSAGILFYILTRLISKQHPIEDIPFPEEYLKCLYKFSLERQREQTDLGLYSLIYSKWFNQEEVDTSVVYRLLPKYIVESCDLYDADFIYLPFGLENGCAGIGLKNVLL